MGEPRTRRPVRMLVASAICTAVLLVTPPALAKSDKGSISGRVSLDPALVDSTLDGIVVSAESASATVMTMLDDDGTYELDDLPNGTYVVSFGASAALGGDATLLTEYYNDVYSPALATPVPVNGSDVTSIDAQLSRTGHFTAAPAPVITKKALSAGSTLGSSTGAWKGPASTTFTYQWMRDKKKITGATKGTYVITTADRGHDITLTVVGSAPAFTSVSRTSAAVHIPKVFTKAPVPKITGTAKAGKTLTVTRGTWSPTPTFSYQWYRNGVAISKATKSTYKLTSSDKGKKITVKVTGKRSGYLTTTKTSAAKTVAK